MMLNIDNLRMIFNSSLKNKQTCNHEQCPSIDTILFALNKKTSTKTKLEIADHVGNCYKCMIIFRFLKDILNEQEIVLRQNIISLKPYQEVDLRKNNIDLKFIRGLPALLFIKKRIISFALFLAIGISLFLLLSKRPYINDNTRADALHLQNMQPFEIFEDSSAILFKWKASKDAATYIVEVFNTDLILLWRSPRTSDNMVRLPNHIYLSLIPKRTYYWLIIVTLSTGRDIESNLIGFTKDKLFP